MAQRYGRASPQDPSHFVARRGPPSLHNRGSLLGVTPPASGRSSPLQHYEPSGHRFADDLEGQNDEQLDGLSAKVKLLKDITIGIGNEVRESTKQLSEMNDAFAETSGILGGTFRRMNNMASRQGCRWLWYIVFLVIVFWFFIVVWWFRR
ncbi:protein transport protein BET1 [Mycena vitilis]|nr:protein transport protein BET1 [Mycena vitilis]